MSKRISFAVALVVIAMLAVACGGGGGSEETSSSSSATTSSGDVQSIEVSLSQFKFNPSEITVKKGQPVEITLTNDDTVTHDFQVEALGVHSEDVAPGKSVTVTFTPDQAGEFEFICSVPGHAAGGMTGTLVVQ